MIRPTSVTEVFALYESRGHRHYGEAITQTDHALQCAALARRDGASDALMVAALLHDIGHLVVDIETDELEQLTLVDDDHEALGAQLLAPIFGPVVAQPVALHVTAKRWRCTRDPDYFERLSRASQVTLRAQGGFLNEKDCERFEAHPGFREALWLRSWDDTAKVEGLDVGTLADWADVVSSVAAAR